MSNTNRQSAETLLAALLRDTAGLDLRELDPNASFLELGFDSLFLIQFSQKIKQKSGVKLTFRQLIETVSTLDALVEYLAQEMPAVVGSDVTSAPFPELNQDTSSSGKPSSPDRSGEAAQSPVAERTGAVSPVPLNLPQMASQSFTSLPPHQATWPSSPVSNGGLQGIEQLIFQQNQLMAMQLQILQSAAMGTRGLSAEQPLPRTSSPETAVPPVEALPLSQEQDERRGGSSVISNDSKSSEAPLLSPKDADKKVFERFGPYKPIRKSSSGGLTATQQKHLEEFISRFTKKTAKSRAHAEKYRDQFADPRGVAGYRNIWKSMVYQISVNRSGGSKLWDIDGNEYIDIAMGFGLNLFGQSPSFVTEALHEQLKRGVEVGPQSPLAGEVARLLCHFSGMDRATFCNTGSEAVMAAMRLARTVTGKPICVFFNKDYHGNFDEVLLRSSVVGGMRRTSPAAPGVPQVLADNTIVLDYGTDEALQVIEQRADDIAAVLVEPVQSADPDFQPKEFMHKLRALTTRSGIAMVMDEVISGFRAAPGGAQEYFGVQGDMATYGKVLGGGLPIGALAGKALYMNALDGGTWRYDDRSSPEADMTFFAGTFVRHPLAMTAAYQILTRIEKEGPGLQSSLSQRTETMANQINRFFIQEGFPIRLARFTSLFRFMFPPDLEYADMLYFHLLDRGIFTRGWGDNCFLSTAHSQEDVDKIIEAVKSSCLELRSAGFFPDRAGIATAQTVLSSPAVAATEPVDSIVYSEFSDSEKKKHYCPLTEAQQEIWVSSLMGSEASCAYNEPFYIKFKGQLDESILQQALNYVLHRHQALKLRFDIRQPLQFLSVGQVYEIERHDWALLEPSQREIRTQELIKQIATTPFDLTHGPLVRLHLVKDAKDSNILYVSAHHIVCDGWSWNLMLKEMGAFYSSRKNGQNITLPMPGEFLRDFVQLDQRSEQIQSLEYWRTVYKQLPEPIELPTDHVRPALKSYKGSTLTHEFAPQVVQRLKRFAMERKVSLFSLAFAAFNVMLRRISGQHDLVVTVPTAGQSQLENDHVVGHCVNLLPVRTVIQDEMTFTQVLGTTSRNLLDAYDHQACTLGSIVREIRCPRDPSRMPLVEINFNLDRDSKGVRFAELDVEIAQTNKSAVNFEVFFNLNEHDQGMRLDLDYNSELFLAETWRQWVAYFENILHEIPEKSEFPVSKLGLLSKEAEIHLLSLGRGDQQASYIESSIIKLFEQQVTQTPSATAVSYGNQRLSYQDLNGLANQLARYLQSKGIVPNSLVGICLERNQYIPAVLLAILKTGAAYVPLDPEFPAHRLEQMIEEAGLSCIITNESLIKKLPPSDSQLLLLDRIVQNLSNQASTNLGIELTQTQPAYVIFTSGSTGRPKGVQIPHSALSNFLCSMRNEPGILPEDRLAAITTLSFDISVLEIFLPLMVGAEVVLVANETAKDGMALAKLLSEKRITILQATPATWRMLIEAGFRRSETLKGLVGGEMLPVDLAQVLSRTLGSLWNMYGPTETTVWSTVSKVEASSKSVSIGRPIANTSLYVLDEYLNLVPPGAVGTLFIGGMGVATGYLNRPELTSERFIRNPYRLDERLYNTGDLVRWTAEGQLVYIGRADHQVKLRGYRIELGEIEHVLASHPGVQGCAVVVKKVPTSSIGTIDYLVGYYVPRDSKLTRDDLRSWLRSRLPEYMVPTWFVDLPELPLTPNRKVDRKRLPDIQADWHVNSGAPQLGPRNVVERQLLNIWKELLKVDSLGVDDNFFELGGHSLLAATLMTRIEKVTGKRIPLATLLQYPTIEGLANILRSNDYQQQWHCIVPIREGGMLLPLFCVHAAGGNVLLYRELTNRLSDQRPVYGIQSSALENGLPKAHTVEEMAREYVEEIRKVQPHGPYHLAGYCLGGTIAYEMARQLRLAGEEIGVLALLDTHANWTQENFGESMIRSYQRIAFHLKNAWMSGKSGIASFIAEKLREGTRRLQRRWAVISSQIGYRLGWRKTEPVFLLEKVYDRASEEYIPKALDAHLSLFKPKQSYVGKIDAFFGWQNYVGDITLIELSVYPAGMLIEPFVAELASHIERQLTLAEDGLSRASVHTDSKQFN